MAGTAGPEVATVGSSTEQSRSRTESRRSEAHRDRGGRLFCAAASAVVALDGPSSTARNRRLARRGVVGSAYAIAAAAARAGEGDRQARVVRVLATLVAASASVQVPRGAEGSVKFYC